MANTLDVIENISRTGANIALRVAIATQGIECNLHKDHKDDSDELYGSYSGNDADEIPYKITKVLIPLFTSRATDDEFGGYMESTYAYTLDSEIQTNDILSVIRSDLREVKFKVDGLESIGTTTSILNKLIITPVGE